MLHCLLAVLQTSVGGSPPPQEVVLAQRDLAFTSPPLELTYASALVDPALNVYLSDDVAPALYLLKPGGDTVRTLMRRGRGPGEVSQIRASGWRGDTLWVLDGALQRITLLPAGRRAVVTWRYQEKCRTLNAWALLRDGRCLMGQAPGPGRKDGDPMVVEVGAGAGGGTDTILTLSTTNAYSRFRWNDGQANLPQPFGDNPLLAIARTSDFVVVAFRTVATSPSEASFGLRVWSMRSGWGPARSYNYRPRPLSKQSRDSAVTALLSSVTRYSPASPVTADSIRRKLFTPRFLPPLTMAFVGRDSLIWLGMRERETGQTHHGYREYRVYDLTGALVRTVGLPSNARPLDAYGPFVWCLVLDSDEVPTIVRFRIGNLTSATTPR